MIWKKKQQQQKINKRPMGHDLLSKKAIAYLQMPCNIHPVLPQQLGTEIWQCRKKSKVILGLSFEQAWLTLRPRCYMPRVSIKAFLVLEKKILSVLPYMGMAAILFSRAKLFVQIVNTTSTEDPIWNLVKINWQVVSQKTFKDLYDFIKDKGR